MLRPLWLALGLLTRLPVRPLGNLRPGEYGRSLLWYPFVGAIIGLLMILLAWLLRESDPFVAAALLITCWVLVTGALHLDGLADSADAWLGGHGDRERTLRIMKDPATGPAGVVGILLVLHLKFAAIHSLLENGHVMSLCLAPIVGRAMLPLLFLTTAYARPQGMVSPIMEELRVSELRLLLLGVVLFILLMAGKEGLLMLAVSLVFAWGLRQGMIARLGGFTGDTAGALVEIVEAGVILSAALSPF